MNNNTVLIITVIKSLKRIQYSILSYVAELYKDKINKIHVCCMRKYSQCFEYLWCSIISKEITKVLLARLIGYTFS
jgi:hypothetical protein